MTEKQSGPARAWPALATLAIVIAGTCVVLLGLPRLLVPALASPLLADMPLTVVETLFTLLVFGLLGLLGLAGARLGKVPIPLGSSPLPAFGTAGAMGAIGLALSLALCVLAGTAQEALPARSGAGLFVLATVLALFQSGAEEWLFRGWLQGDLQRHWGRWPALATTALTFAALHFVASASEPLTFVTMLLGGLLFGLVYQKSGSILTCWALHFGWNWTEDMVFGLTPNPGTGTFGALINIDLQGSPWWGGTAEGLNASLSSIIVLAALIGATLAWPERDARAAPLRKALARG